MQEVFDLLIDYGYVILFLYSLGGGMIALLAAALLASGGFLNLWICIGIAAIANFIGDNFLFYAARFSKNDILPYFRKQRRKLAFAYILFKKYGYKIIFFKKYIYGLKTLIPLVIGISKFSAVKFNIANGICAILWSVSVGSVGFLAGDFVRKTSEYFGSGVSFSLIFFIFLLVCLWLYFEKNTKSKKYKKIDENL